MPGAMFVSPFGANSANCSSPVFFCERPPLKFCEEPFGTALTSVATLAKKGSPEKLKANVEGATKLGKAAAEAAKGKGIKTVVFDRAGTRYHGKIKALADAAREAGLQF